MSVLCWARGSAPEKTEPNRVKPVRAPVDERLRDRVKAGNDLLLNASMQRRKAKGVSNITRFTRSSKSDASKRLSNFTVAPLPGSRQQAKAQSMSRAAPLAQLDSTPVSPTPGNKIFPFLQLQDLPFAGAHKPLAWWLSQPTSWGQPASCQVRVRTAPTPLSAVCWISSAIL